MKTKICGKCNRKLSIENFYSKGNSFRWECKSCGKKFQRLKQWCIPFEVEDKYVKKCERCGAYITEEEVEDNDGGICDICSYDDEAMEEWGFLNSH